MINKWLGYLSDFFIFSLIFSFYNDSFLVGVLGANIIKVLVLGFMAFYLPRFIENAKTLTDPQIKMALFFFTWLFVVLLIEMILGWKVEFAPAGSAIIAVVAMIFFFIHYPLEKTLYFIWISMMASVVMSHFNHPIDEYTFRTSGGTEDPNEFATQLIIFLFASFYLFTKNHSKLFLAASVVFFTYGFFKAGSKSSFLILGVMGAGLILHAIIAHPRLLFNYKTLIAVLLSMIALLFIDPTKISGIQNMIERSKNSGTADMRMHSWEAGFHMIEQRPVFGVGGDAFAVNEPLYEDYHMVGSAPAPHNIYIKLAAESGIPIFLFFLFFLFYITTLNFRQLINTNAVHLYSIYFATLLMGLTLGYLYDKYFWLSVIIIMNLNYQIKYKGYIE